MSADPGGSERLSEPPGRNGPDNRPHRGVGSAHPATAVTASSGGPTTAAEPRWGRWREIGTNSSERFVRDRCNVSAWALACRGFLAIFPALIALLGLVQLLHLSTSGARRLTASINSTLPPGASGALNQAVNSASHESSRESVIVLIGGILVALWSVTGGVSVLQVALDVAYEVPHDRRFVARRLRSLPLMLAIVILGLLASALSVFGASIGHAMQSHVPLGGTLFPVIWAILRWLVTVVAITLLLQVCYIYGPNRKTQAWRWISPGSAIAAAVFVLASLGFSFYVKNFGSYGKTYGAFAAAVILILWLYLAGLAVLFGAELNAQAEKAAAGRPPT